MREKLVGGLTERDALSALTAPNPESVGAFRASLTDTLNNLCSMVAHVTGAQTVVIAQQDVLSQTIKVCGKVGTLVTQVDMTFVLPELNYEQTPIIVVPDIRNDVRFYNHPLLKLMPHMKSLTAMLIPVPPFAGRAVLKIINARRSAMSHGAVVQILADACAIASGVLRMASMAAAAADLRDSASRATAGPLAESHQASEPIQEFVNANENAAAQFLLETLLNKRILHSRNGLDYMSLRTWRQAIKKYQIAALNAVKLQPPKTFVACVAKEIADSVRQSHGDGTIGSVVPVPPGSSEISRSFARQVAAKVAELIGAAYADALESRHPVKPGKSSPHKSGALRPYKPVTGLTPPILIIDDVASSGRHLELAINAIKTPHVPVYAIAWIGKS